MALGRRRARQGGSDSLVKLWQCEVRYREREAGHGRYLRVPYLCATLGERSGTTTERQNGEANGGDG